MASLGKGLAKAWQGKSLPDGSLNRDARGDGIHTAALQNGDMVQVGGAQATASSASPPAGVLHHHFPTDFHAHVSNTRGDTWTGAVVMALLVAPVVPVPVVPVAVTKGRPFRPVKGHFQTHRLAHSSIPRSIIIETHHDTRFG